MDVNMSNKEEFERLAGKLKNIRHEFYEKNGARIQQLLSICKEHQGQYLESHHGPGSWATTYSNEFIQASAELYEIYSSCKLFSPLVMLSNSFIEEDIKSCRGVQMTLDRVEYLYNKHLKYKIDAGSH